LPAKTGFTSQGNDKWYAHKQEDTDRSKDEKQQRQAVLRDFLLSRAFAGSTATGQLFLFIKLDSIT
jgi:hypothetical protein